MSIYIYIYIYISQVRDFATIGNSVQVMWESLFGTFDLGPVIGNFGLSYVEPTVSVLFFLCSASARRI